MKNFLKFLSKRSNLLLIAIFVLAIVVRFYNFPNRVTFWTEQARTLEVSSGYLEKPSFLGQEYFRVDSFGHQLFTSATSNYSLVPLLLAFKFEPISVTAYFALLNVFAGFLLYYLVRNIFKNQEVAFFSLILFLFNNYMIYHSLFIWILNYFPILGVLLIYFFYSYYKTGKLKYVFWLGFVSGLAFGSEYVYLFTGTLVLAYVVFKTRRKLLSILLFGAGAVAGDLPMVLFDIKHNFYNFRTLWQFFIDSLQGISGGNITYYHFLHFWPLFALLGGYFLSFVYKKSRAFAVTVLVVYLIINIHSPLISFNSAVGMPRGLTVGDLDNASKKIAADAKGDFNVAEVLDFDKRGYVFRYFIQYKYRKIPMGVEDYPNSKVLYVLAQRGYNFDQSKIWEITSGGPYKVIGLSEIDGSYEIYKLIK